jgi:hypothetical protein
MSSALDLPGHEVFVSNIESRGALLSVRLVSDYHPGADPQVYVIEFDSPSSPEEATTFLAACKDAENYVYVAEEDGVTFTTESGEGYRIEAHKTSSTQTTFNEKELTELSTRVYAWYLAENDALRTAQEKINAAQHVLLESARRTEIKAASHEPSTTAAILYSQQLELIQRVLNALRT